MGGVLAVYISGKITGIKDYLERFETVEHDLILHDYDAINPAKVNNELPETSYSNYIKMPLCMLSMCDTIYMMKDWETSIGAKLEWEFAKANNYTIIYQ